MAKVYVMCGLPGSGKTTIARHIAADLDAVVISSDSIREELYGDESVQGNPSVVFNTLYNRAHAAIDDNLSVILDATNVKKRDRARVFQEFPDNEIAAFVINTPVEVCKQRNEERERVVPEYVIDRMAKSFEMPTHEEGFVKIYQHVC